MKMVKADKTTLVVVLSLLLIGMSALLLWSLVRGRRPNFLIDTAETLTSSKKEMRFAPVPFARSNTNKFKISVEKQNVTNNETLSSGTTNHSLFANDYLKRILSTNATNDIENKNSGDSPLPVLGKVVIVTSTCEMKSCSSANKLFYEMATNIITNQHQFSSIKQLKCKMGEFAAAEEKLNTSSGSPSPCYYTSSESFLSPPNLENVNENRDALKIYLNIYKELLSSLLPMSKKEGEMSTREKLIDQLLSLEKTMQILVFDMDNVLHDLLACSCSQRNDKSTSSKVYTQSYQQLASKFGHTKSAFVTLKQLEIVYNIMKRDIWKRQSKFILAC